jgi:hypothetical protein
MTGLSIYEVVAPEEEEEDEEDYIPSDFIALCRV